VLEGEKYLEVVLEGEKYLEVVFGGLKICDLGIIFPRSIWKYGGILHLKLHKEYCIRQNIFKSRRAGVKTIFRIFLSPKNYDEKYSTKIEVVS